VFDQLPRHEDDRGDWDRDHLRDHTAVAAKAHLRHAAQVAFEVHKQHPFDHLIISAPDELSKQVEAELHSYLRERIAARLSIAVSASEAQITAAALDVEQEIERAREAGLVDRLREWVGMGKAVAGLAPVIDALVQRRVDTLLVSDGYETPGWRCLGCDLVAVKGRACPACGGDMHQVDDVVEEAVEAALAQSCTVLVCAGNADLDVQGQIGALLRF
jgi:peptide subunit release factor 1 (eRF1)